MKQLGFANPKEYFNHVIEIIIKGETLQATQMIEDLSKPQKKDFIDWLDGEDDGDQAAEDARQMLITALQ